MKYKDYLNAAKRHDQACSALKEKIEEYKPHFSHQKKFQQLVRSLYYLSGYVLECSLKFKILEASNFCPKATVDKNEVKNVGIDYYKDFRIHDLNKLHDLLISKLDIECASYDFSVNNLLESWRPEVRYEDSIDNFKDVEAFYNHTKFVMGKVQ